MLTSAALVKKPNESLALRDIQARAASGYDVGALVQSVEGTIRTIARSYSVGLSKADRQELIGAGREGAVVAAQRFDQERSSFNTYATFWIRLHIVNEVFTIWARGRCKNTPGSSARKIFYHHSRVRRELENATAEAPTPETVADQLGVPSSVIAELTSATASAAELASLTDDSPNALDNLCSSENLDALRDALGRLDGQSRYIIVQQYDENRSCEEIARSLRLSKRRVEQIAANALAQLRRMLS